MDNYAIGWKKKIYQRLIFIKNLTSYLL